MKKYIAYTDGSYQDSIKAGGYASIIFDEQGNKVKELYQGFKNTTNNRMEALAVLATLEYFKEPVEITIVSDSMYVVNTIAEDWVGKWYREKDYSKKNLDIWFKILDYLSFHKVTMEWTKGHADNEINNEVDELCVFAARCLNLPEDEFSNKSKKGGEPLVSVPDSRGSAGFNVGSEDGKITYSLG